MKLRNALRSFSSSKQMEVIVTSYNILCSKYGSKDVYPECSLDDLDPVQRLERLKLRFRKYVEGGHIICLQEVTQTWYGELFTFFSNLGYAFICSGYSNSYADYMGSAIAYPATRYTLLASKICWIGGTIDSVEPEADGKAKRLVMEKGIPNDAILYAIGRPNTAIFLAFEQGFAVSNYHVPAAFWNERVRPTITLHAVRYIIEAQKFARGLPLISVGDFNMTPDSTAFKIITRQTVDTTSEYYPRDELWGYVEKDGVLKRPTWSDSILTMQEAYFDSYVPTCHAIRKDISSGKVDLSSMTIDYIFYTADSIEALEVGKVFPITEDISLPTKDEPSDHLPVSLRCRIR
jgi:mRNA deadenylase 3'-5' endonuclease subunit Ccr4